MSPREVEAFCTLTERAEVLVKKAFERLTSQHAWLSGKLLKVDTNFSRHRRFSNYLSYAYTRSNYVSLP